MANLEKKLMFTIEEIRYERNLYALLASALSVALIALGTYIFSKAAEIDDISLQILESFILLHRHAIYLFFSIMILVSLILYIEARERPNMDDIIFDDEAILQEKIFLNQKILTQLQKPRKSWCLLPLLFFFVIPLFVEFYIV